MKLSVYYNDSNIDLSLPDDRQVDVFDYPLKHPRSLETLLPEPVCARIREFVLSNASIIIINDAFRPTPTASLLRHIFRSEDFSQLTILIATGAHPTPDKETLEGLVGREIFDAATLYVHSAYDESEFAGASMDQVALNRHLVAAKAILIIGSVEPHYFAGFTGGRKIILPGCASFADIERNHSLAVSDLSQPMERDGNPVWDDIQRRTACLNGKKRLALQVVCDYSGNLFAAAVGNWDESHDEACEVLIAAFRQQQSEPYDVIICVVYPPLDRNFYQLQKSYENVKSAVRDGGTILLVSACPDGVGDRHFIDLARNLAEGREPTSSVAGESGLMGIHKLRRTQQLAARVDLILFSELRQPDIDPLPIRAARDLKQVIQELMEKYGRSCRVAVVLDSASQVIYPVHHFTKSTK